MGTGFPVDTYRGQTYYSYVNRDNATAKGLTFSAEYNISDWAFNLDYTYMNALGTSSDVQDAYNDLAAGKAPRVELVNLDWDQAHAINFIFNYNNNGWNSTLTTQINSGFPYTPEYSRGESTGGNAFIGLQENSSRRPTTALPAP